MTDTTGDTAERGEKMKEDYVTSVADAPRTARTDSAPSQSRGEEYVIRHSGAFYRPNAQGYTYSLAEAWRLPKEEAEKYVNNDPHHTVTIQAVSEIADRVDQELEAAEAKVNALRNMRAMLHPIAETQSENTAKRSAATDVTPNPSSAKQTGGGEETELDALLRAHADYYAGFAKARGIATLASRQPESLNEAEGRLGKVAEALRSYEQADEDGVMVLASRQACEEGAALLLTLSQKVKDLTAERDEALKALDENWVQHQRIARAEAALQSSRAQVAALTAVLEDARRDLLTLAHGERDLAPAVERIDAALSALKTEADRD
jgi:hypothetical protein